MILSTIYISTARKFSHFLNNQMLFQLGMGAEKELLAYNYIYLQNLIVARKIQD